MRVRAIRARPDGYREWPLELEEAATVEMAIGQLRRVAPEALIGVAGCAVFGERVSEQTALRDGDRLELLEALQVDPKQARRRRAEKNARKKPA